MVLELCLVAIHYQQIAKHLRYHGRWIFTKNLLLAVQTEKTEIIILQNEWGGGESIFTF